MAPAGGALKVAALKVEEEAPPAALRKADAAASAAQARGAPNEVRWTRKSVPATACLRGGGGGGVEAKG